METDECSEQEETAVFVNYFEHCNTSKLLLLSRKSEKIWKVYVVNPVPFPYGS